MQATEAVTMPGRHPADVDTSSHGDLKPVPEQVVSWRGRAVKWGLYGVTGLLFASVFYEAILAGISVSGVFTNSNMTNCIAKGVDYFPLLVKDAVCGTATLLIGLNVDGFIAEKKLESNVEELGDLNTKEREQTKALQLEVNSLNGMVAELKNQLENQKKIIDQLNVDLELRVKELGKVHDDLEASAKTLSKVDLTIQTQKQQIQQLDAENIKLKKVCEQIRKESEELDKQNTQVRTDIQSYDRENNELKSEIETLKNEKNELSKSIALLSTKMEELSISYEKIQKERAEIFQKMGIIKDVDTQLLEASARLQQCQDDEKRLLASIEEKTKALEMLNLKGLTDELQPILDALKAAGLQKPT